MGMSARQLFASGRKSWPAGQRRPNGQSPDSATLLRVAHAFEQATPWRDRRPDLTRLKAAA